MWTYAPDLDERTPNILLTGSTNVVPTTRGGMRAVYSFQAQGGGYPDIAEFVCGAGFVTRDSGTARLFAGTPLHLKEANQTVAYAWTDVSRGANYSGVSQWMFDQYGATSLAAASVGTLTEIQSSTGAVGTAFANLTNAPKARIIVVQDNALYAFDYDSGGGEIYDGWIRSDTGSITSWTPGTAECVSGRFTEAPGGITAAIKQGNGVVVFKNRGMWRGQYVGLPEVVRWELITPFIGCCGPLAVVNIDDVLYFAAFSGFYRYDGSRPQKLSGDLDSVWKNAISDAVGVYNGKLTAVGIDDVNNILSIYYQWSASSNVGTDTHINYHYLTGAWGPPAAHNVGQVKNAISAVLNGSAEKIGAVNGLAANNVLPTTANAMRFVTDATNSGLVNMYETSITIGSATLSRIITVKPSVFGSDTAGAALTRLYPTFRSYNLSGVTLTASRFTIEAYRRPFSVGSHQVNAITANYSSTLGYADTSANGNWFAVSYAHNVSSASGANISYGFEWMGLDPEFASARPKN